MELTTDHLDTEIKNISHRELVAEQEQVHNGKKIIEAEKRNKELDVILISLRARKEALLDVKNHINYVPAAQTLEEAVASQAAAEQPIVDNDHVAAGCDTFDSPMEAALAAVSEAKPVPGNDNGEVFTA
jgi:hypothetical protein